MTVAKLFDFHAMSGFADFFMENVSGFDVIWMI